VEWPVCVPNNGELVVDPRNSPLSVVSFSFVQLSGGDKRSFSLCAQECLIVLLKGTVSVSVDGTLFPLGPRSDVFSQKSTSLYIGKGDNVHMTAASKAECIIVYAPAAKKTENRIIHPSDVGVREVGEDTYFRHVHDILSEEDVGERLLAGETFNRPGKWSSFPPHKHDVNNGSEETALEEVYFFKVAPENAFGIMHLYGHRDGEYKEQTIAVRNNDCVVIPYGYHPVCALPNTQLYYFWVLAGEKRQLRFSDDPQFSV